MHVFAGKCASFGFITLRFHLANEHDCAEQVVARVVEMRPHWRVWASKAEPFTASDISSVAALGKAHMEREGSASQASAPWEPEGFSPVMATIMGCKGYRKRRYQQKFP